VLGLGRSGFSAARLLLAGGARVVALERAWREEREDLLLYR